MNKDATVEFRGDHIHVDLEAGLHFGPGQRDEFWHELKMLADEHGSKRVLVEGWVPDDDIQTTDIVEAGHRTASIPKLWLAFHLQQHTPNERGELYETIAASHGVRVKFFTDAEHALRWLRNNAPS